MKLYGHGLVALAESEREFLSKVAGKPIAEVVSVTDIESITNAIGEPVSDGSEPFGELTALLVADMAAECRALTHGGRA